MSTSSTIFHLNLCPITPIDLPDSNNLELHAGFYFSVLLICAWSKFSIYKYVATKCKFMILTSKAGNSGSDSLLFLV